MHTCIQATAVVERWRSYSLICVSRCGGAAEGEAAGTHVRGALRSVTIGFEAGGGAASVVLVSLTLAPFELGRGSPWFG